MVSLSSFIKQKKGSKGKGIFMGFLFYHFYWGLCCFVIFIGFCVLSFLLGFFFYHFYLVFMRKVECEESEACVVSEGHSLVSEGRSLVSEGHSLVSEERSLVSEGRSLVSEGRMSATAAEHLP